jgi:hypothetical protein
LDGDNNLYDPSSHEQVGTYDPATKTVIPLD